MIKRLGIAIFTLLAFMLIPIELLILGIRYVVTGKDIMNFPLFLHIINGTWREYFD